MSIFPSRRRAVRAATRHKTSLLATVMSLLPIALAAYRWYRNRSPRARLA